MSNLPLINFVWPMWKLDLRDCLPTRHPRTARQQWVKAHPFLAMVQFLREAKLQVIQGGYCGPRLDAAGNSNWAAARRAQREDRANIRRLFGKEKLPQ
jgi:hypothetical protein